MTCFDRHSLSTWYSRPLLEKFNFLWRRCLLLLNFTKTITIYCIWQNGLIVTFLVLFVWAKRTGGCMVSINLCFLWFWRQWNSTNFSCTHLSGKQGCLTPKRSAKELRFLILNLIFYSSILFAEDSCLRSSWGITLHKFKVFLKIGHLVKVKLRCDCLLLIRLLIVFYNHLFLYVHKHGRALPINIIALLLG